MFDQENIDQLKAEFWEKHRACEKAAYALAGALPVGAERTRFFSLYEIIRTAPRESA
ncbi:MULTISPECIES: hypothetical protein [unclassified Variovorax]|uniref:hypothetical protein n=1 Tax=unclassified Variovorax TaxID=663243 RepID=UPI003F487923